LEMVWRSFAVLLAFGFGVGDFLEIFWSFVGHPMHLFSRHELASGGSALPASAGARSFFRVGKCEEEIRRKDE
jgi:hypothetical protein